MKFSCLEYPSLQICAAILSLAVAVRAEEHPDDVPSKTTVNRAPSRIERETAPRAGAPEAAAPDGGAPEPGGPPEGRPPGGPGRPHGAPGGPPGGPDGPPGALPLDGPPPMAVGELHVGLLTRVDLAVNAETFKDPSSTTLAGLGAAAQVLKNVRLTTAVMGTYDPRDASGVVSILDAVIEFEPTPALNVWLGRMVEPIDRSTLSGPWFMAPWYLTGIGYADGQVALPHTGPFGRSNGATVWGTFFAGHLKYYASAFDLVTPGESPMLAGRLNLSLLSPEPGYFHSSSYYGRDILAIGVGAQSKKGGSVNPMTQQKSDYTELSADLLFEKNMGSAGVVDLEGAYYKFTGDYERTSSSWFGLASYVLPGQIGGARLQPLVRMQQATPTAPGAPTSTIIDGQLSILLNGYFARLALGYRRAYAGPLEASSVFLGLQFIQL